ncbi:hypothetical protein DFR48_103283 [Ciceribacter lividus]|uniref:Uncharacterized protein n=1 Tax=Ciceribacter lividus TaxID=1197950 RepID=A0A6I7HQW6_9HYPH|nr:hypothetical protein [Ciceribacter lividus]RCW27320.1 hypothetical protein DFR48_103283 [Ciceribacter lividus]
MDISQDDVALIRVMKHYFETKAEVGALKAQLETARRAAGTEVAVFYDPRCNLEYAEAIVRQEQLKRDMLRLMDCAEAWGRGEAITALR